jgi:hypothetical protein
MKTELQMDNTSFQLSRDNIKNTTDEEKTFSQINCNDV